MKCHVPLTAGWLCNQFKHPAAPQKASLSEQHVLTLHGSIYESVAAARSQRRAGGHITVAIWGTHTRAGMPAGTTSDPHHSKRKQVTSKKQQI